jgi:hypothetical protein
MRRLGRWLILLTGVLIASRQILWFAKLELGLRFAGVPWSWDFLARNAQAFTVWAVIFLLGLLLIAISGTLFVRARRAHRKISA